MFSNDKKITIFICVVLKIKYFCKRVFMYVRNCLKFFFVLNNNDAIFDFNCDLSLFVKKNN